MKVVFNSLGSNYSLPFVAKSLAQLLSNGEKAEVKELEKTLSKTFQGKAYAFYKGRQAIEFCLRYFSIGKGDCVLTQAFTCWAVEEGIGKSGAKPVFVDTGKISFNLSVKSLERAFQGAKGVKALIVQHTFGYAADVDKLSRWCDKKNIILIEDLAHSFGAKDRKGRQLGTLSDAVILSFGRDKIVDAVSGGACIIKNKPKNLSFKPINKRKVPFKIVLQDLFYPLVTWFIRNTYYFEIGKFIHFFLRSSGFLLSATESRITFISELPASLATLAIYKLSKLPRELGHRKKIAQVYFKHLKKYTPLSLVDIESASNLRFPILVKNPSLLISCLKNNNIYVSDRWYKNAVDYGSLKVNSLYKKGSCPNAELLAKRIVNLPTHISIDRDTAEYISENLIRCLS